jgi:hypothetical protein
MFHQNWLKIEGERSKILREKKCFVLSTGKNTIFFLVFLTVLTQFLTDFEEK